MQFNKKISLKLIIFPLALMFSHITAQGGHPRKSSPEPQSVENPKI